MNESEWTEWFEELSLFERVRFLFQAWIPSYAKVWMNERWLSDNVTSCMEKRGNRPLLRESKNILERAVNEIITHRRKYDKERAVNSAVSLAKERFEVRPDAVSRRAKLVIDCIAERIMYSLPQAPKGDIWVEFYRDAAYVALFECLFLEARKHELIP